MARVTARQFNERIADNLRLSATCNTFYIFDITLGPNKTILSHVNLLSTVCILFLEQTINIQGDVYILSRFVKQHCQNRYGYLIRVPTLSLDKMCGVTLLRKHQMGKMNNQISWMQWDTCCHTMLYILKIGKSYFETMSTDSTEDFIEYLSVRFNYLNHVSLCSCVGISWSREVYFFVKQSSSGSHRFVSTFQFVNIK